MKYDKNRYDKFLNKLYQMLILEGIIKYDEPAKDLKTKVERVKEYLEKVERVQSKTQDKEKWLNKVKRLYYNRYIIKEENIPDSYFEFLGQKYLNDGHGHINLVKPQSEV